jgi:hypothetical protein
MPRNEHFLTAESWEAAADLLTFTPRQPAYTANAPLKSLEVRVRDHKLRDIPLEDRNLEAHYGQFVISQSRKGKAEAKRWALDVSYGQGAVISTIFEHDARVYPLGPEPEPGDPDGRMPAIVAWHDAEILYLVASDQLEPDELVKIAMSMYA